MPPCPGPGRGLPGGPSMSESSEFSSSVSPKSRKPPPLLVVSLMIFLIFSSLRILFSIPSCVSMTTTPTLPTRRKSPTCKVWLARGCFRSPNSRHVPEWREKASGAGTAQYDPPWVVTSSWQARVSLSSYLRSFLPTCLAYSAPRSPLPDWAARWRELAPWMMTPSGLMVNWVNLFFLFCCDDDDDALLLHGYTLTSTWASRRELISLAGLRHREAEAEAEAAEDAAPPAPPPMAGGAEWLPARPPEPAEAVVMLTPVGAMPGPGPRALRRGPPPPPGPLLLL
mmetsp:Transcript_15044/g.43466  ORF Transcript_15044/g.43466 Transcript_15044/m.43466 type:complete len:283 (-) Transcript_15044:864-1712(-)